MQSQPTTRRRAVAVPCLNCGTSFKPKPAEVDRGKGKYCSVACRATYRLGIARRPAEDRFWEKVDRPRTHPNAYPDFGACWLWLGCVGKNGYGRFTVDRKTWNAHQWGYLNYVGPVPSGYELDHLCRIRHCVNWNHLDPVPHRVNALRGMAPKVVISRTGRCARGHETTDENVYRRKGTGSIVYCRPCRRLARCPSQTD